MSYCRWGADSDLYIYESGGGFVCCSCALDVRSVTVDSEKAMADHVRLHVAADHRVPEHLIEDLEREPITDPDELQALWERNLAEFPRIVIEAVTTPSRLFAHVERASNRRSRKPRA